MKKVILLFLIIFFSANAQDKKPFVKFVGSIKNVKKKGVLNATIYLDSIPDRANLFALGPVENLQGELMILDGNSYVSEVDAEGMNKVKTSYKVGAPFLVYCNVKKWREFTLENDINSLSELQNEIQRLAKSKGFDLQTVFPFKISGQVETAKYHVIWKDLGVKIHSPEIHKKSKVFYPISKENADILGFYSQNHAGIFTHHDSFIHAHIITADKNKMGHLDEVNIRAGEVRVYLPELD